MIFSEQLAEIRKDKGYTQKHLAETLNISRSSMSNYEKGTNYPDLDCLIKIADFLDVSTDYLLGRTTSQEHSDLNKKEMIGNHTFSDFNKHILELVSLHNMVKMR